MSDKKTPEVKIEENQKIQIHLDGSDFQGFALRLGGLAVICLLLIGLTGLNEALVFLVASLCWLAYFFYKIITFKEDAYHRIIEDLEEKNSKLEKSNKLLQNVVKDSLGMRVSTDEGKPGKS